ncbi:MAG: hypothetical protein KF773_10080 [Deltaproteobacteria bacterium]|nr:hypothetical protein [Deltaproteobacteria bacterium]
MRTILVTLLLASSTVASAAPEELAPGLAAPLPGKQPMPRRSDHVHLALSGSLLLGGSTGLEGAGELRLWEALGLGLGFRAGGTSAPEDDLMPERGGSSAFLRMTALGLAINRWGFFGYADYHFGDRWSLGGAMTIPLRRDDYLRISITSDLDDHTTFGIGLERDVW